MNRSPECDFGANPSTAEVIPICIGRGATGYSISCSPEPNTNHHWVRFSILSFLRPLPLKQTTVACLYTQVNKNDVVSPFAAPEVPLQDPPGGSALRPRQARWLRPPQQCRAGKSKYIFRPIPNWKTTYIPEEEYAHHHPANTRVASDEPRFQE